MSCVKSRMDSDLGARAAMVGFGARKIRIPDEEIYKSPRYETSSSLGESFAGR